MFVIDGKQTIHITRGDTAVIVLNVATSDDTPYTFQKTDVVRIMVTECDKCGSVVMQKTFKATEGAMSIDISLDSTDTRFCEIINAPKNYWYEIELNPETNPQTIIGYDRKGPKIFRVYPEGEMQ